MAAPARASSRRHDSPVPGAPDPIAERAAIQAGLTGDKVPALDPAAAPLGTDEEAGGTPLTTAAPMADPHVHWDAGIRSTDAPGVAETGTPVDLRGRGAHLKTGSSLPMVLTVIGLVLVLVVLAALLI